MTIKFLERFALKLADQIEFIALDKLEAARRLRMSYSIK